MWELTTGCKPFDNVKHDHILIYEIIDGKRPEITYDTPECFANLMKRCWDSDPSKRPSISEICNMAFQWRLTKQFNVEKILELIQFEQFEQFEQSEKKRLELIQSKKLGPEFSKKSHPKAIFTSRALSPLISKHSSINSSLTILFNTKQGMYLNYFLINILIFH